MFLVHEKGNRGMASWGFMSPDNDEAMLQNARSIKQCF